MNEKEIMTQGIDIFLQTCDIVKNELWKRVIVEYGHDEDTEDEIIDIMVLPAGYDIKNDPDEVFQNRYRESTYDEPVDDETILNIAALCKTVLADSEESPPAFCDVSKTAQGIAAALTGATLSNDPDILAWKNFTEKHVKYPLEMGYDKDKNVLYCDFRIENNPPFQPRP